MIQTLQIAVTFYLGEGEEDMMKGGVNDFGREHGNKCACYSTAGPLSISLVT